MSKFEREEKVIDRLERLNRELKAENRRLHKLLKQINKGFNKLRDEEKIDEEDIPKVLTKVCWDCSGELIKYEMVGRRWYTCDTCGKRTPVKFL
jgi:rubrerythrin